MGKIKVFGIALLGLTIIYLALLANFIFAKPAAIADHPTKGGLWIRAELVERPANYLEGEIDEYMQLAIENLGKCVYVPSRDLTIAQHLATYKVDEKYYKFEVFWVDMWDFPETKQYVYSGICLGVTWIVFVGAQRKISKKTE